MTKETDVEETTGTEQEAATPEQDEQQAEASFASGFNKANGTEDATSEQDAAEEPEPEPEKDKEAEPEPEKEPIEEPAKSKPDDYDSLNKRIRDLEGTLGGFRQKLESTLSRAGKAADDKGGKVPSPEQIRQARASGEKFKALKEDFPEWGDAIDEEFTLMREAVLKEVAEQNKPTKQPDEDEITERVRVGIEHPDWKTVLKSDEFVDWLVDGGPSMQEYRSRRPGVEVEWARKYPKWWVERGAYIYSPHASDVISTLNSFKKRNDPPENADLAKQEKAEKNKRRLQGAKPAPSAGGPVITQPTDQKSFEKGFHKAI